MKRIIVHKISLCVCVWRKKLIRIQSMIITLRTSDFVALLVNRFLFDFQREQVSRE